LLRKSSQSPTFAVRLLLVTEFKAHSMDFEVQRCTRICAATQRQLQPEETFYSVLIAEGANVVRHDYSVEAWQGPPPGAIGWWKSTIPARDAHRVHWAPNDVMLHLLDELESQDDAADMRYVLALLLVRRRVLRLEEAETDAAGDEWLVLYSPRKEATLKVRVATPTAERAEAIQQELGKLLLAGAT
jgi:hypothetical protein